MYPVNGVDRIIEFVVAWYLSLWSIGAGMDNSKMSPDDKNPGLASVTD